MLLTNSPPDNLNYPPQSHEYFMDKALSLAEYGIFSTAPNPRVGCVLVKEGKIVGEGFHQYAGEPHAEVYALRQAGANAQGATAYVTLEPCAHYGRTPPCAKALCEADVSEVYIACTDPNPLVAGKGIEMLNQAGIKTHVGILQDKALWLNRGFFKRILTGKPFVTLKLASSLDGRTALANGKSQWITGEVARQDVQRERLMSDAIIAGTGSVIQDKARLTARYQSALPQKQPLRVLIDSQLRATPDLPFFQESSPILLAHTQNSISQPYPNHCEPKRFGGGDKVDLEALLLDLGQRGVNYVLVEAGANLAGAFLQAQQVDQMLLYLAPTLLGQDARPLVQMPMLQDLSAKMMFTFMELEHLNPDFKMTLLCSQALSKPQGV
ncbi:MAG: bifunctional diaminohydroxyphosphoribosylaminopyrimidine deaminase/5-amino-6-(5-phosphoribosylamino)uracil reductase RibD [Cardiobacteriaceae bacterium]|nr:bifunctional diaminohydroxyphosphoribosylaminopyrimidine deaminase/5-amino-6-(5-phosphoribosylamino)uracil reductase RibD [Cardiobacteriaceae bacterium]